MRTALVLFTCDLRVHDHPALAAAARDAEEVATVFVLDDTILGGDFARPNRLSYLCDALADLDRSLRRLGTPLIVRRGDVVDQTMAVADEAHAGAIYLTEGVSAYARRRAQRLSQAAASARSEVRPFEGITVVPPVTSPPVAATTSRCSPPITGNGRGPTCGPSRPRRRGCRR